ncbi:MAG: hypothetical protein EA424_14140 [Planctomycetaceae bacterium]|nr:MAG: hypothetical protein EA424_14140 [Planctomycetaceae bacterium]
MERGRTLLPRIRLVLLGLLIAGPFLWLFGPALFTRSTFAFRDAAHYYYPLFQWSSQQWSSGQVPLWNPHENCGMPVLADATSSVFYPGKLIFLLPVDFATSYNVYVAAHVLLAAWGVYRLARRWSATPSGAVLGAMAYAFSGSVLFQHCNVVFLIGAAWLPLAVEAADRLLTRRRWLDLLGVALIWAMMVLGGDPQSAYHAALLAVLQAFFRRDSVSHLLGSVGRLGIVAALALALAAVQIVPSARWSSTSQRAVFDSPRSVYEVAAFLLRPAEVRAEGSIVGGLFGRPASGRHDEHIYHFSLGPWRLAELVWPNVSGRMFPVHHRWASTIPAEGRIWTPSIYLGLIPLLLALRRWRLVRGQPQVRWASWVALAGTLASFGWYGLGWIVLELQRGLLGTMPQDIGIGQPVGGLYWALVTVLPGYAMFRFPAKLFIIATLGLSLLAAWGFDDLRHQPARRFTWMTLGLALISLIAGGFTWFMGPIWHAWFSHAPADGMFGPLDLDGSLADLRWSLLQTGLIGTSFWGLMQWRRSSWSFIVVPALLIGTAVDLTVAHHWLVPTAPTSIWQQPGRASQAILSRYPDADHREEFRVFRGTRRGWLPRPWATTPADDRLTVGLQWDVDTMAPKYPLLDGLAQVEAYSTLSSADFMTTLRVARRHGWQRSDGVLEPHRTVLDALGARYFVLPDWAQNPGAEPLTDHGGWEPAVASSVWFNPQAFPRAWIVRDIEVLPPLEHQTPRQLTQRTREVWFFHGRARNLRQQAIIESDRPPVVPTAQPVRARETCHLTLAGAQRVDVHVRLEQPGLLVLSDLYDAGWLAILRDPQGDRIESLPIHRTNRFMRGVWLPAGQHHVSFLYRPRDFYAGAAISVLAWLGAGLVGCWRLRRARPTGPVAPTGPAESAPHNKRCIC